MIYLFSPLASRFPHFFPPSRVFTVQRKRLTTIWARFSAVAKTREKKKGFSSATVARRCRRQIKKRPALFFFYLFIRARWQVFLTIGASPRARESSFFFFFFAFDMIWGKEGIFIVFDLLLYFCRILCNYKQCLFLFFSTRNKVNFFNVIICYLNLCCELLCNKLTD